MRYRAFPYGRLRRIRSHPERTAMKTHALIPLILISLTSLGCHTTKVATPHAPPLPDVSDVLRSVSLGVALVTNESDVSRSLPQYEYVVFPTRASLWNVQSRLIAPAVYISQDTQECQSDLAANPRDASDIGLTSSHTSDSVAAWTDYCTGKVLTMDEWDTIDRSHLPPSLSRCCRSSCRH
jgi:hypothetical protein